MSIKCPNCGSTAQVRLSKTEYNEDGWTIEVIRIYTCGCGCKFKGVSYYHCEDAHEDVTMLSMTYPITSCQSKLADQMIRAIIEKNQKNF
jgi:hypothetical protein